MGLSEAEWLESQYRSSLQAIAEAYVAAGDNFEIAEIQAVAYLSRKYANIGFERIEADVPGAFAAELERLGRLN